MAKKYINAKIQVVPMDNSDIVTTSIAIDPTTKNTVDRAPGRRSSIWD